MRLSRNAARWLADNYAIPLGVDFHALVSVQVERVIAAADAQHYRAPQHANGSRARYFHAYLQRAARREEV